MTDWYDYEPLLGTPGAFELVVNGVRPRRGYVWVSPGVRDGWVCETQGSDPRGRRRKAFNTEQDALDYGVTWARKNKLEARQR